MSENTTTPFDLLAASPNRTSLVFKWLDPSSLTLAACVCKKWRVWTRAQLAEGTSFRLRLVDLLHATSTLAWAFQNLNERQIPHSVQKRLCELAARNGRLETLQWALANGCPWGKKTCSVAAHFGQLAILQWAHASGHSRDDRLWDEQECAGAAINGHLKVLQWLRANGCPWDARTCAAAAWGGYFEILQWARANDCPWDADTCAEAAWKGYFEILKWARANGCPWDKKGCLAAAKDGAMKAWIAAQAD